MPACCVCFRREEGGILNCSGDPKGERLKETDHNKSKGFLFPMLVKPATEQKEQRETKQPKARKDASSRKTNGDKPLKKDMPKAAKKTERKKTEPQKGAKAKKEVLVKSEKIQSSPANEKQKGKRGRGKKENKLKVLFFGGVGEIGKNTTALQYGDEIIVIDAGITFPDETLPGVDLVVPDISYLVENKDKIKGILLTHGHEDHIGGLPYMMKEINEKTPIYATKLTHMLAENKLKEHRVNNTVQKVVKPRDVVKLGNFFEVEFVGVNHSIAGALALAIRTPCGVVYHSGDFKIDLTPVAGEPIDLATIARLGREGVLLMLDESTNIERPGYTMSEKVVGTTLDHLFSENGDRRIIIATFASNVHRLQQIIDLAVKYRRKVALSGRSMLNVVDAAVKIGELHIPEGVLVNVEKTKNLFDRELVILSTGSQGEPMSALTRMAAGEFKEVTVGANDTVIVSASPIPGNEKMVYRVINQLYQRGAKVVYESLSAIHVSGHACIEEHKILHSLLNPKFFIPVHGEYRHLKRHAMLAEELGMPAEHILIPEIGCTVELTENSMKYGEKFAGGARLIDGSDLEDLADSDILKDRRRMGEEGTVILAMAVSSGFLVGEVKVILRGFFHSDKIDYERDIAEIVENVVDSNPSVSAGELAAAVRKTVKNYIFKKTKQSPLIVPVVQEI